jgi:hypothetical protein
MFLEKFWLIYSVVQCLLQLPQFIDYYLAQPFKSMGSLDDPLHLIFHAAWSLDPAINGQLQEHCNNFAAYFTGHDYSIDAFFRYLFENISSYLVKMVQGSVGDNGGTKFNILTISISESPIKLEDCLPMLLTASDILIIYINDDVSCADGTVLTNNIIPGNGLKLAHMYRLASCISSDHRTTVESLSDKQLYSFQNSSIYQHASISDYETILFYVKNGSVSNVVESIKKQRMNSDPNDGHAINIDNDNDGHAIDEANVDVHHHDETFSSETNNVQKQETYKKMLPFYNDKYGKSDYMYRMRNPSEFDKTMCGCLLKSCQLPASTSAHYCIKCEAPMTALCVLGEEGNGSQPEGLCYMCWVEVGKYLYTIPLVT